MEKRVIYVKRKPRNIEKKTETNKPCKALVDRMGTRYMIITR